MGLLPGGTVTFLFTDIEGSTRLWESDPIAMKAALARHHAILHQAIESNHGTVFQIVGDGVQAAFAQATQALAAAVSAQQALIQETWEATSSLRVRIGLNTGMGEPLEHDYAANQTLNRVARVVSAAYGGQILLSQETADLVRLDLPPGISLKDLGNHRLKGLSYPEHLFQVIAPGLWKEFPVLPTQIEYPNNLPPQFTSFVGREAEIAAIREKLLQPEVRLLTLTGVGGTGKTRLSIQVGQRLLEAFPEGVFFIPLAPIHEVHLVIPSIAETLGLRESPDRPSSDLLKEHLAHKHLLLILDNFEQILEAAPRLNELLAAAPQIKILVTSRTLLRLTAEHGHPVSPLHLPKMKARVSKAEIEENEAVKLFVLRALAVKPDFKLTEENAAVVAEICRRLDGLPLAIELAAARCRLFTPQKMLGQLGNRLQLLEKGARDLPERHQTMRAAIGWSYALLNIQEQILFRRLALFAGGCFVEAVEAVCSFDGIEVINGLESLLDKNLIGRTDINNEPRFWMYETIREYGLKILEDSGEGELVRQRHARYYILFMKRFSQELNRLETELDNLRAILRWSIDSGKVELGYRLTNDFWFWGDRSSEGRQWLAELLALPSPPARLMQRGYSIFCAGFLAIIQGDFDAGRRAINKMMSIAQHLGNEPLHHLAQYATAFIQLGEDHLFEALQIFLELENSMDKNREWWIASWVYYALSDIMVFQEEYAKAEQYLQSAYEIFQKHNRPIGIADYIVKRGFVALAQGNHSEACLLFRDGLKISNGLGFKRRIGSCIWGFAGIALGTGDLGRSAKLFGAAETLIKITGSRFASLDDKTISERNLVTLRARLDENQFAAAWQEGMELDLEEAIAYALEIVQ